MNGLTLFHQVQDSPPQPLPVQEGDRLHRDSDEPLVRQRAQHLVHVPPRCGYPAGQCVQRIAILFGEAAVDSGQVAQVAAALDPPLDPGAGDFKFFCGGPLQGLGAQA